MSTTGSAEKTIKEDAVSCSSGLEDLKGILHDSYKGRLFEVDCSKKNSSISLIKLIGMILIIMSHITPDFGDTNSISYISSILATPNIQEFYVVFSKYLGQIGVCIFAVSSAFFLVDRDKIRTIKAIEIEIDTILIGLIMCFIAVAAGFPIGLSVLKKIVLPMSRGSNWYVGCYILYYLTVPYINRIFKNIEKEELFKICMLLFIFYSVLQMIFKDNYYSNHLVGFYCIHFFTYYYKYYLSQKVKQVLTNVLTLILSAVLLVLLVSSLNYIGVHFHVLTDKMQHFRTFMNPLILLFAFSVLGIAVDNRIEIDWIDKIASLTLFMYVFHENDAIKNTIRPAFFLWVYENYSYTYLVLICVLAVIATYVVSILISIIYKITIHRIACVLSGKVYNVIHSIFGIIYRRLK